MSHPSSQPSSSAAPRSDPGLARRSSLYFSCNVASWFGAWGMQQVLFSWIVVGELGADPDWVGIAQSASMFPALFLLLLGGAAADRFDPRRLLIGYHAVAVVPTFLLAYCGFLGWIDLRMLIAYGLVIGTVQAFSMPARDALLSRVATGTMMRAVSTNTAVQSSAQVLGAGLAGLAGVFGSSAMLIVQGCIFFAGSLAARRIAVDPGRRSSTGSLRFKELGEGIIQVLWNPTLRPVGFLVLAVGMLFLGPYLVVFPIMVRDHYHGGVGDLAMVLMLFPLGTIAGSLWLRRFGIRRKGPAALYALALGSISLLAIASGVSFRLMIGLVLVWGLAGSVFINCTRTLYQEAAPPAQRGRVLGIYQLGFFGGAPIGTLVSGFAVEWLGIHGTLMSSSFIMLGCLVWMTFLSGIRRLR